MQPGDVQDTFANIENISEQFGYRPLTSIDLGIKNFVNWYKQYFQTTS